MHSSDGRHVLVLNGEIYNYRELREDLRTMGHQFRSDSDTEVLLHAWQEWDKACLTRLIGMFAFAVYDRRDRVLTLVRDAFGIKPLYFSQRSGGITFASEMAAVLALEDESAELNPQRVYDYLIHGVQDAGFETFVRGVSHVPPAHLVRYRVDTPDKLACEPWWTPSIAETSSLSFADASEALRGLFLRSVQLHLRSDVPLGAALSGGIDSSALVCAMRSLEPDMPIHTFSYVSADADTSEERWIDIVNRHVGAEVHKVHVEAAEFQSDLADLIRTQGEPFCTTSMYAQYRVFQKAREDGITVVLEGQGADELLAGYHGYAGQRMRSLLESGQWLAMSRFASKWKQWPGRDGQSPWRALVGQLLPDQAYRAGLPWIGIDPLPDWMDTKAIETAGVSTRPVRPRTSRRGRGRRVAEVLSTAITDGGLPSLLRYGDRNAMRFSIENRVPFLTVPIADFLLSLPEHYLISTEGETKSVFRAAMRGIVPDVILDRRAKIGFETPMREWLTLATDIHHAARSESLVVLEPAAFAREIQKALRGEVAVSAQHWRLLNLAHWARSLRAG